MAKTYYFRKEQELKIDDEKHKKYFIGIMVKNINILDELWLILDYGFIGLLFYWNAQCIHSILFNFALFIWLMLMVFNNDIVRNKKEIHSKEEFLEEFNKAWEEYEKAK